MNLSAELKYSTLSASLLFSPLPIFCFPPLYLFLSASLPPSLPPPPPSPPPPHPSLPHLLPPHHRVNRATASPTTLQYIVRQFKTIDQDMPGLFCKRISLGMGVFVNLSDVGKPASHCGEIAMHSGLKVILCIRRVHMFNQELMSGEAIHYELFLYKA